MKKHQITAGVYVLDIPELSVRILCGCPMDSIKSLMRSGFIQPIEDDQWEWESGPNAILLSDISIQNGAFCNLTEFPLMHMLYKQGMAVPGHPGHGIKKPLIIGIPEQISGQIAYLDRGVNGLTIEEINQEASLTFDQKREVCALKRKFKYNQNSSSSDIIDFFTVSNNEEPYLLVEDLYIVRLGLNVYLFQYKDQEEIVDLTLTQSQHYGVPYNLDFHPSHRRDFSIIHSGEGNGWDKDRPSMGSILCIMGKLYLIDAGPNIAESLEKLGISLNEIEGLFQTHAHDDHFSGLASIIRSEKRIKFYSTTVVRHSVMKKLSALINFNLQLFHRFFDVHDLLFDQWTKLDGFEVMPVLSPHPVETNIFYFRKKYQGGYRSYAHLADIISRRVYEGFIAQEQEDDLFLKSCYETTWKAYLRPVNIKKIDANGGLIHGDAKDFFEDQSGKIIFSHTNGELSNFQKEHGSSAVFGGEELLIATTKNYIKMTALNYLNSYFPLATDHEKSTLLNNKYILISAGTTIIKKNSYPEYIYITLSGTAEYISEDGGIQRHLPAGSLLGEAAVIEHRLTGGSFRALSYIKALKIPTTVFATFLSPHLDTRQYRSMIALRNQLQLSPLFSAISSRHLLTQMMNNIYCHSYKENDIVNENRYINDTIALITEGMAGVFYCDNLVETLSSGGYFGQENLLNAGYPVKLSYSIIALSDIKVLCIPTDIFLNTPSLLWNLIESSDKLQKMIAQTARLLENSSVMSTEQQGDN